ncbi:MAG: RHS repeat-associated core domain-containing protein, partial [Myxococcota bacterium]
GFTVTVADGNAPPRITSTPSSLVARPNVAWTYTATAVDPDDLPSELTWTASSDPDVTISGGVVTWTPAGGATGTKDIEVTVRDPSGNEDTQQITIGIATGSDNRPPTVALTSPRGLVTTDVPVIGTATDDSFAGYQLELCPDLGPCREIAQGLTQVERGELGVLHGHQLPNGEYTLRLTATDADGNSASAEQEVTVEGEKFGKLKIAVDDMVVARRGGQYTLSRSYDGFDTQDKELGYGWSYDIESIEAEGTVALTSPLDEGWKLIYITFPPAFEVDPTVGHTVLMELADGRAYSFYVTLEHQSGLGSIHPVRPQWSQTSGASATMRLLSAGKSPYSTTSYDLWVNHNTGGAVEVYEDAAATKSWEPRYAELTTELGEVLLFDLDAEELVEGTFSGEGGAIVMDLDKGEIRLDSDVLVVLDVGSDGHIQSATDRVTGAAVRYRYDGNGDLVGATEVSGDAQTFTYGEDHRLEAFEVDGAQPAAWWYDYDGRLLRHQAATGALLRYTYEDDDRRVIVTDAAGNATVTQYDTRGRTLSLTDPLERTVRFTYADDRPLPATITDALGHTTAYRYDPQGRRTRIESELGSVVLMEYGDDGSAASKVTDGEGRVYEEVMRDGAVIGYKQPDGSWAAQITSSGDTLTETSTFERSAITYDERGRETVVDDAEGRVEVAYNNSARTSATTYPSGETSLAEYDVTGRTIALEFPEGDRIEYSYNGANISEVIAPNGMTMRWDHDSAGRLKQATLDGEPTRKVTYDSLGRTAAMWSKEAGVRHARYDAAGQLTGIKAGSELTKSTYDAAGRKVRMESPDGTNQETVYDADGRVVETKSSSGEVINWAWDKSGNPIEQVNAVGQVTTMSYDVNGRLASITEPSGAVMSTTWYAGKELSIEESVPKTRTGFDGARFTYRWTDDGYLLSITDDEGGVTQFDRDESTGLTITDGEDREWRFTQSGDTSTLTWPSGNQETWLTVLGEETWTRADGTEVTTEAPEEGLLTVDAGSASWTQESDLDANTIRETHEGNRHWHERTLDDDGLVVMVEDDAGAVLRMTRTDGLTDEAEMELPDGTHYVGYGRDIDGWLDEVEDPSGSTASFALDGVGRVESITRDNGVTSTYTYGTGQRPTQITHAAGGTEILSVEYEYEAGILMNELWSDGHERTYAYDALGRLRTIETLDSGAFVDEQTLSYDAVGNLISIDASSGITRRTYDQDDRLLSQSGAAGTRSWAYSDRGAVTEVSDGSDVTGYTYDELDRLESATLPDGTVVSYRYDLTGRLLGRTVDGVEDRILPTPENGRGLDDIAALYRADGSDSRTIVHGPDGVHSLHADMDLYTLTDALGNVIATVDDTGSVVDRYRYDPWGQREVLGGEADLYGWIGELQDPETGLVFLRRRWYDPATGRFLTPDRYKAQTEDPRSLHRYLYGLADPINNVDRSGEFSIGGFMSGFSVSSMMRGMRGVAVACVKKEIQSELVRAAGQFAVSIVAGPALGALGDLFKGFDLEKITSETPLDLKLGELLCDPSVKNRIREALQEAVPFSVEFQVRPETRGRSAHCGERLGEKKDDPRRKCG